MADLNEEIIKATGAAIGKNLENMTVPTSKSIGDNIGLLVDGVFGWLGTWGEKLKIMQQMSIQKFKKKIEEGITNIPTDRLIEPKVNIIGPAVESAKYYFEEEYYKDMFSKLIIASCDKDKINAIHPSYIEIIKQLSPLDAKIISMFKCSLTFAAAKLIANNDDNTITPSNSILCDFKENNDLFDTEEKFAMNRSIDNLERLGLVVVNTSILELKYDYDKFINYPQYLYFRQVIEKNSTIEIKKCRLELTNYGRSFFEICM
jgi:hypothetical protein